MSFLYGVFCPQCELQELSEENYMTQLKRLNASWRCPKCGEEADWDDDSLCMIDEEEE